MPSTAIKTTLAMMSEALDVAVSVPCPTWRTAVAGVEGVAFLHFTDEGVAFLHFTDEDVVRHSLVTDIVNAYDKAERHRKAAARYERKDGAVDGDKDDPGDDD